VRQLRGRNVRGFQQQRRKQLLVGKCVFLVFFIGGVQRGIIQQRCCVFIRCGDVNCGIFILNRFQQCQFLVGAEQLGGSRFFIVVGGGGFQQRRNEFLNSSCIQPLREFSGRVLFHRRRRWFHAVQLRLPFLVGKWRTRGLVAGRIVHCPLTQEDDAMTVHDADQLRAFFDALAPTHDNWRARHHVYYDEQTALLLQHIEPGLRVL